MIINIFSIFDSNILNIPINIIIITIILIIKINTNLYWTINKLIKINKNKIFKFFIKNKNNKPIIEIFIPLSVFLTTINLINLIPNIISTSRIINFNLSITIALWINIITINIKNYKTIIINITPKNTPKEIIWIINVIEINRIIFQILSLTIRLSINIILGHIIIIIINKTIIIIIYIIIETIIIIIQSYIYITLNILNFNNTN